MKKQFKDTKLGKILNKVKDVGVDIAPVITKVDEGNVSGAINEAISILSNKEGTVDYHKINTENATKRWEFDMASDSWLSKNVRPLTLAWLIVSVTTICILDSAGVLTVREVWITLFSSLLITVIVAYFGGRSYEKGKKIK